jgi:hypothetical protein
MMQVHVYVCMYVCLCMYVCMYTQTTYGDKWCTYLQEHLTPPRLEPVVESFDAVQPSVE